MIPLWLRSRGHRRGIIKRPQCFEALYVKLLACSTIQTRPVRSFFTREWPCQVLVPTSEERADQADPFSERFVRSIYHTLCYQILFQNPLHIFLRLKHQKRDAALPNFKNARPGKVCISKMSSMAKRFDKIFHLQNSLLSLMPLIR